MLSFVESTSSKLNVTTPSRFLISDLCALLDTYLEPDQVKEVYCAYLFSAEAHEGQTRLTGEPYIFHPLSVARILADMHMDAPTIIAAILHDVIEDTPTKKEVIAKEFGPGVAELVDGVSKLTHLVFETKAEAQAEYFQKMMLAMVQDIRVIIVKLTDRLHNMRTIGAMKREKQCLIARETLDIYAPLARRLGMNKLRVELEQLAFQTLWPMRHEILSDAIKRTRVNRKELMQTVEANICGRLEKANISSRIYGREKDIYSIYKKMKHKKVSFSEIHDVFAFRIIVDEVDTCYRALGVIHNLYKPVPGAFKDYIAIPKKNGYQSLHTICVGPQGVPIEIQMRSQVMDHIAEAGIAAHWLYKSGDQQQLASSSKTREWLKNILDIQKSAGSSLEFLENIKVDLFPDEIYVFSPMGKIFELPRGSTAVDFAYAVHSDIGNHCIAAKVNRQFSPLSVILENGQTVEVITDPNAKPSPVWLNFVITAKARTNIRHYLRHLQKEEAVELGRRLLEQALHNHDRALSEVSEREKHGLLKELGQDSMDGLLEDIGMGNRMAQLVARHLVTIKGKWIRIRRRRDDRNPLAIRGTEGMVVVMSKCCYPIPGDPIVGIMSAGRGLVVHQETCRNLRKSKQSPDKWVSVYWSANPEGNFPTEICLKVANEPGVLAVLAAKISEEGSNIENIVFDERHGTTTTITFLLTTKDRTHLAKILRGLKGIPQVYKVARTRH